MSLANELLNCICLPFDDILNTWEEHKKQAETPLTGNKAEDFVLYKLLEALLKNMSKLFSSMNKIQILCYGR